MSFFCDNPFAGGEDSDVEDNDTADASDWPEAPQGRDAVTAHMSEVTQQTFGSAATAAAVGDGEMPKRERDSEVPDGAPAFSKARVEGALEAPLVELPEPEKGDPAVAAALTLEEIHVRLSHVELAAPSNEDPSSDGPGGPVSSEVDADPLLEYDAGEEEDDYNALVVRNAEIESKFEATVAAHQLELARVAEERDELQRAIQVYKESGERMQQELTQLRKQKDSEIATLSTKLHAQQPLPLAQESGTSAPEELQSDQLQACCLVYQMQAQKELSERIRQEQRVKDLAGEVAALQQHLKVRDELERQRALMTQKGQLAVLPSRPEATLGGKGSSAEDRPGYGKLSEEYLSRRLGSRADAVRHAVAAFAVSQEQQQQSGGAEVTGTADHMKVIQALVEEVALVCAEHDKVLEANAATARSLEAVAQAYEGLLDTVGEYEMLSAQVAVERVVKEAHATVSQVRVHETAIAELRRRTSRLEAVVCSVLSGKDAVAPQAVAPVVVKEALARSEGLQERVDQLVAEVVYLRSLVRSRGVVEVSTSGEKPPGTVAEATGVPLAEQGRLSALEACCYFLLQRTRQLEQLILDGLVGGGSGVCCPRCVEPQDGVTHGQSPSLECTCWSPIKAAQLIHAGEHIKVQNAYIRGMQQINSRLQQDAQFVSAVRLVALGGGSPCDVPTEGLQLLRDNEADAGGEPLLDTLRRVYNESVEHLTRILNGHIESVSRLFESSSQRQLSAISVLLRTLHAADGLVASILGVEKPPQATLYDVLKLSFSASHAESVRLAPDMASFEEGLRQATMRHEEQLRAEKEAFDKKYGALEKKLLWLSQQGGGQVALRLIAAEKEIKDLKHMLSLSATAAQSLGSVKEEECARLHSELNDVRDHLAAMEVEAGSARHVMVEKEAQLAHWKQMAEKLMWEASNMSVTPTATEIAPLSAAERAGEQETVPPGATVLGDEVAAFGEADGVVIPAPPVALVGDDVDETTRTTVPHSEAVLAAGIGGSAAASVAVEAGGVTLENPHDIAAEVMAAQPVVACDGVDERVDTMIGCSTSAQPDSAFNEDEEAAPFATVAEESGRGALMTEGCEETEAEEAGQEWQATLGGAAAEVAAALPSVAPASNGAPVGVQASLHDMNEQEDSPSAIEPPQQEPGAVLSSAWGPSAFVPGAAETGQRQG